MSARLTPRQAAAAFGVSPATLRRWARLGRIHPIHTPEGPRYDAALVALMTGAVIALADEPVSGRSKPRVPLPPGFAHAFEHGETRAACKPCDWSCALEPGHSEDDFGLLEAMHAGLVAA